MTGIRYCLFLAVGLLFGLGSVAQVKFQRTFGGTSVDRGFVAYPTSDGGYLIAGQYKADAATPEDQFFVKMNSDATVYWTRTIGGASNDYVRASFQTTDGGYVFVGHTTSYGAIGANNIYLTRVNSDATTIWSKAISTLGGASIDEAYSVVQTADNGFMIAGVVEGIGMGDKDLGMISVNSDGTAFWVKSFGSTAADRGASIYPLAGGGYIFTGQTMRFNSGDMYFLRTNSDGSSYLTTNFGTAFLDYGRSAIEASNGDIVVAGETGSNSNLYLVRSTSDGSPIWSRSIGGSSAGTEGAQMIRETSDGGFIIAGSITGGGTHGGSDVFLVKTNSSGVVSWAKAFGGTNDEFGHSVAICPDGGYLIAGYTNSFGAGNYDLYLIKTDSNGSSGCNENAVSTTTATITTNTSASTGSSSGGAAIAGGSVTTPTIVGKNACTGSTLMPVECVRFSGKRIGRSVCLDWVTANESDNEGFVIERSEDGLNFQEIGFISGAGNSSVYQYYQFVDQEMTESGSEVYYYRLKQVDYNGEYSLIGPVAVRTDESQWAELSLQSPNLGEYILGTLYLDEDRSIGLEVLNFEGRIVDSSTLDFYEGANQFRFRSNSLKSGIYLIKISAGNRTLVRKFIQVN